MIPITSVKKFQNLLQKAIDVRESALYPDNPLFELPLDIKAQEITQKEQVLLKCLLQQFNKLFTVESICKCCAKRESCNFENENVGECGDFEGMK
jgi:hypothetical protein